MDRAFAIERILTAGSKDADTGKKPPLPPKKGDWKKSIVTK